MLTSSVFPGRLIIPVLLSLLVMSQAAFSGELSLERFKSSSAEVTALKLSDGSLQAELAAGAKGSPGVIVLPAPGEVWDFTAFSRIEAVIQNAGEASIPVSLRVDNKGHWKEAPWSTESVRLEPGQTATVVVFFGFSHGMKPSFALDRSQVTQLLFFAPGADQNRRFVVKSVSAAGGRDETPDAWRNQTGAVPEGGVLSGVESPLESSRQLFSFKGASIEAKGKGDRFKVQFTGADQQAGFQPLRGKWDLRGANGIAVEVLNTGREPILPGIRIESPGGATSVARPEAPVEAGMKSVIPVPFSASSPWIVESSITAEKSDRSGESGTGWVNREATAITFLSEDVKRGQTFEVVRITAVASSVALPEWVGTKPPVEGDWVRTLNEDFDAPALNESLWNTATANHWDKRTAFSRENVNVSDGVARLRFEHRTSRHNDDPEGEEKAYTSGFLDTFGKWKQRYGYFEARMKLPTAPGLWPAFWMMPDRGPDSAPRWKREQTTNGGMEFDIMEYLSGWGPYRYNVAFHWDGYGEAHRHAGTSGIYFQPDEDGFVTTGLLWLPGQAVYYCNGVEVGHWESDRVSNVPSILMFTHVSGGWDNEPLDNAKLPDDFVIDYVRCWQRRDLE